VATGTDLIDSDETGNLALSDTPAVWFLAGIFMINCSLIYLIILGDFSVHALIAGSFASTAIVVRVVVAASIFVIVALLGGLLVHRSNSTRSHPRH
jgi:hypothetical protein